MPISKQMAQMIVHTVNIPEITFFSTADFSDLLYYKQ
jgi:hypothetical protein